MKLGSRNLRAVFGLALALALIWFVFLSRFRWRVRLVTATLLVLAGYGLVVRNEFINLADNFFIYNNPQVRQGINPGTLRWALTGAETSNW